MCHILCIWMSVHVYLWKKHKEISLSNVFVVLMVTMVHVSGIYWQGIKMVGQIEKLPHSVALLIHTLLLYPAIIPHLKEYLHTPHETPHTYVTYACHTGVIDLSLIWLLALIWLCNRIGKWKSYCAQSEKQLQTKCHICHIEDPSSGGSISVTQAV